MTEDIEQSHKSLSVFDSLFPVSVTVVLLIAAVMLFGADAAWGPAQIVLLVGTLLAAGFGVKNGYRWKSIEAGLADGIYVAIPAMLILLTVGSLIGIWILAGTVPAMIYYGLELVSPSYFYASCCLLCALVSLSIGSSWSVAGTIGLGLIGIAEGFGLSLPIAAGAIVSGAYFGDKMSPLSDTTNIAPAAVGADLFAHIRQMMWTTLPSIGLALVAFLVLGLDSSTDMHTPEQITAMREGLASQFNLGPHLLIPVLVLLGLSVARMPALPAVSIGAGVGVIFAVLYQQEAVFQFLGSDSIPTLEALVKGVWTVLFDGYVSDSGNASIDALLSKGGMSSMLTTLWLVISAMAFGGVIERLGMLDRLVASLVAGASTAGSLVIRCIATCFVSNLVTGDQYLSVTLPGRMYKAEFQRRNLASVNLSRATEDGGTITSPLIPWNSCGAYMAATLGVATLSYLPFVFFNLINVGLAITYAFFGIRIVRIKPSARFENTPLGARVG
ncbi:Na+/H+ antiporter NhaC [Halomonas nitroreducens]|uniref:Na+/H+ antiporter NhaC n=1 Tax=Halomonas nitroreducens TaxID=447425 RepID=A0A431V4H5_9GAMM|nr:Na+/H+ antiporter NhaC [Halomonas nitroreducens]RTR02982.1 Na+/H+ antiporter NhaC [Halomonas nitroreducens]